MQSANYDSPVTVQGNSSGEAVPVTLTSSSGATATQVQGAIAHDSSATTTNPVRIGARARSSAITAVTADDVVDLLATTTGAPLLLTAHTPADGATNAAGLFSRTDAAAAHLTSFGYVFNGTTWDRMRGDATYGLKVQTLQGLSASAVFTPAAASHVAGDVHGGAQTFDLNAPASSVFEIQSASLLIAGGTVETTAWELHLFSVTPPSALADDGAFVLASGDHASYLGFVALAQVVDYGDALYIESNNVGKRVQLAASGDLFAYLVNRTTLTPQAVAHTVKIVGRPV